MKQYEYKKVPFSRMQADYSSSLDLEKLNREGEQGWEFVAVSGGEVFFKREKDESSK